MFYELLYIIPQQFEDEKISSITEKVAEIIKEAGGRIIKEENLGKKKLAYLIKQTRRGFYILLELELLPSALQELNKNLRLMDNVLRFQIIKTKPVKKKLAKKEKTEKKLEISSIEELNKKLEEISGN